MTTDIKGLVARLRAHRQEYGVHYEPREVEVCMEAASALAALEAELDEARAERDRAIDERDEARQAPWPEWADEIRKCLEGYGVDPGDEWDLPAQFEDWLAGAVEAETARATVAEAERNRWKAMHQQSTSVIAMSRAMIGEMFGPVIESEEATLLRGPESKHDGEAILEALQKIATERDRLRAERDRYKSGLQTLATSFYREDQHQDFAKHVLAARSKEPVDPTEKGTDHE